MAWFSPLCCWGQPAENEAAANLKHKEDTGSVANFAHECLSKLKSENQDGHILGENLLHTRSIWFNSVYAERQTVGNIG